MTAGVGHSAAATAAGTRANISNAMLSSGGLLELALLDTGWELTSQYVLSNQGGVLTSNLSVTHSAGTDDHTSVTPNVAIVVNKNTGLAGRQYRGKFSMPAGYLPESEVNEAGIIDSTYVSSLQANADQTLAAMTTNAVPMYILHDAPLVGSTPVPTLVDSLVISDLVGTQRRRLRR